MLVINSINRYARINPSFALGYMLVISLTSPIPLLLGHDPQTTRWTLAVLLMPLLLYFWAGAYIYHLSDTYGIGVPPQFQRGTIACSGFCLTLLELFVISCAVDGALHP